MPEVAALYVHGLTVPELSDFKPEQTVALFASLTLAIEYPVQAVLIVTHFALENIQLLNPDYN